MFRRRTLLTVAVGASPHPDPRRLRQLGRRWQWPDRVGHDAAADRPPRRVRPGHPGRLRAGRGRHQRGRRRRGRRDQPAAEAGGQGQQVRPDRGDLDRPLAHHRRRGRRPARLGHPAADHPVVRRRGARNRSRLWSPSRPPGRGWPRTRAAGSTPTTSTSTRSSRPRSTSRPPTWCRPTSGSPSSPTPRRTARRWGRCGRARRPSTGTRSPTARSSPSGRRTSASSSRRRRTPTPTS